MFERKEILFSLLFGISVVFLPPALAKQATVLRNFSSNIIMPVKCSIRLHDILLTNGRCIVNTKGANDTLFAQGNGCAVSFKRARGLILATLWSYRQPCHAASPEEAEDGAINDQPWKVVALVNGCWRTNDLSVCFGKRTR